MNQTRSSAGARRRPGRRGVAGAVMVGLLLVTAACGSSTTTSSSTNTTANTALLGEKKPATGDPVKVGFISDGRSDVADYTIELQVADAAVKYLNDYKGGIAGRPIQLVTCETHIDPAKTADCANQMIQDDVVAVIGGLIANVESAWQPLHDAHIPYWSFGAQSQKILLDKDSTFLLMNTLAALVDVPAQVAKDNNLDKVTAVVIDLPTATIFYQTIGPAMMQKLGIKLDWVAIPADQADVTPQMQKLASGDPGLVEVIGGPTFCTAVFNGLRSVGFHGKMQTIAQCLTADVTKAVPNDFLDGVVVHSTNPIGDASDPGMQLYNAVMAAYGTDIDTSNVGGPVTFTAVTAFAQALEGISATAITPASIITTLKAMKEMPLPVGGGLNYRCNGKAVELAPAICARGALITTLDANARPTTYQTVNNTPIPD